MIDLENPINQSDFDIRFVEVEHAGRLIYVVVQHPVALYCWRKAYEKGVIGRNSTLIHIDKHFDFRISPANRNLSRELLNLGDAALQDLVSHKLHPFHDEFIVNAMFGNLIGDGVAICFDDLTMTN